MFSTDVPMTTYEVWQHTVTAERWLVRIEYESITGVYGPLERDSAGGDPMSLLFEDHPDDLEWFIRESDRFRVLSR